MTGPLGDTESWGLLVGVFLPLLVAVVQQPHWTPSVRWAVGWGCAIVAGALTCLANGTLGDGATVLRTCAVVLVAAQAAHAGWKSSGAVPAIEEATSPPRP